MSFEQLVQNAANQYGIPVNLLNAVIQQESGGQADVVSPAGAIGVMQLMPDTAAALGVENPYDPAQNINGGAKYLRQQMDRFGDTAKALAAYNAGPGAVEKYGGIPPYEETQNYVKNIMANSGNPTQQSMPISVNNPLSGNPIMQLMGKFPTPNYDEKLPATALAQYVNTPVQNAQRTALNSYQQSMPILEQLLRSGNPAAIRTASPAIEKMMALQQGADVQDTNIENEANKRNSIMELSKLWAASRNPQNMGALASAIQGLGGQAPSTDYMNASMVNPSAMLGAATSTANAQAQMALSKYAADQSNAMQQQHLDFQKQQLAQQYKIAEMKAQAGVGEDPAKHANTAFTIMKEANELIKTAAEQPGTPEGQNIRTNALKQAMSYYPALYATNQLMAEQLKQGALNLGYDMGGK